MALGVGSLSARSEAKSCSFMGFQIPPCMSYLLHWLFLYSVGPCYGTVI